MPWILAVLALWIPGCAFEEGNPWGRADLGLVLDFQPVDGRLTPEGRLKTASDYAVALDRLSVRVDAMSLVLGASGESALGEFDPANPPEGYGLCHGGHCHADDGRLVSYEEIAAEMGAEAGGGFRLDLPTVGSGAFDVAGGAAEVAFGECPDACELEEGSLALVEASLTGLEAEGRVFDRRTGEARRLPEAGVPFRGKVDGSVVVKVPVSGAVGNGKPVGVRVRASLVLTERVFDRVDWAAGGLPTGDDPLDLSAVPGAGAAVLESIRDHSTMTATVERF
jgi:hypothetical protein